MTRNEFRAVAGGRALAMPRRRAASSIFFSTVLVAQSSSSAQPLIVRKGLARHELPVFRLARLAVNRAHQGQGLGGQLLLAAGRRCLLAATEIGGLALLIDAKNERAAKWYALYGAVPLADAPLSLLLPLATIR